MGKQPNSQEGRHMSDFRASLLSFIKYLLHSCAVDPLFITLTFLLNSLLLFLPDYILTKILSVSKWKQCEIWIFLHTGI